MSLSYDFDPPIPEESAEFDLSIDEAGRTEDSVVMAVTLEHPKAT